MHLKLTAFLTGLIQTCKVLAEIVCLCLSSYEYLDHFPSVPTLTRLPGVTMITLLAIGLPPYGPCFSKVLNCRKKTDNNEYFILNAERKFWQSVRFQGHELSYTVKFRCNTLKHHKEEPSFQEISLRLVLK